MQTARTFQHNTDQPIQIEAWLTHIDGKTSVNIDELRHAIQLASLAGEDQATPHGDSCLQRGLNMADILADLSLDPDTLAAAICYSSVIYADLNLEDIQEQLGPKVAKLITGTKKMAAIDILHQQQQSQNHQQLDNIRKMFLAMVDDVRVVLIKLAEHLCMLRLARDLSAPMRKLIAKETMDIYAPLANRLGIGQMKWQLEDLAFRYMEPEAYKKLSKSLNTKRSQREHYVNAVKLKLEQTMHQAGVNHAEITGRAKHIYSIHRKMQRKNVDLAEIYDAIAFRILLPTIEDCYTALGEVHALWKHIPKEFDDYINSPKPNGYQSIHTAVVGPEQKHVEIQIRTQEMHEESEMGVAAHWKYKEGATKQSAYEEKIAWLRQVMDWQKELTDTGTETVETYQNVFEDRVYVFTPSGDIIDLAKGATPLDFAYNIHSEIGHRCRGAKINGKIVPLTYILSTGEKVDILTTKQGHPSRDWLNPHLGYLKTSRAKAKVHHWFRTQNFDKNLSEGHSIYDKEIKRLNLSKVDLQPITKRLNYKTNDDLLAGLGRGDVKITTIIHALEAELQPIRRAAKIDTAKKASRSPLPTKVTEIEIQGVGNLLTHFGKCCKPVPGDVVIGYVTLGRGVSIHRGDCRNLLHSSQSNPERLLEVSWGEKTTEHYPVDLSITANDRHGLVRDLTNLLSNDNITILGLTCSSNKKLHTAIINLTIEIPSLAPLSRILAKISQLKSIEAVKRA